VTAVLPANVAAERAAADAPRGAMARLALMPNRAKAMLAGRAGLVRWRWCSAVEPAGQLRAAFAAGEKDAVR